MTRLRSLTPRAVFISALAAFLVWAAHLVAIYGVGAVICADAATQATALDPEQVFVFAATAAALLAIGILLARVLVARAGVPHEMIRFGRRLAAASCVLSIIAVLWQALPAILIPACT